MEYSNFRKKRTRGTFPNGAVVEGADYMVDMERNRKRRRVMVDYEDSKWDPKYISFLADLEKYWESKFVEEDEEDPTYVMFLQSLKKHGNSYMVDVSIEHGVSFPIIYEDETSSWDGVERTRLGTDIRKEEKFDVDRRSKSGFKDCSFKSKGDADVHHAIKRRWRRVGASDVRKGIRSGWKDSGYVNGDEFNATHATKTGYFTTSWVSNIWEEGSLDADREFNFSRKNSGSVSKDNTDHLNRRRSLRSRQSTSTPKEGSSNVNRALKSGLRNSGSLNEVEVDSPHMIKRKSVRNDSPDLMTRRSPISRRGSCIPKNGRLNVQREANRRKSAIWGGKEKKVDEAYESFITALKVVGESVFCEFVDHKTIFYESDKLIPTDTAIGAVEAATTPITETCTKPSATSITGTPAPAIPTANPTMRTPNQPKTLSSAKPTTSATTLTSAKAPVTSPIQPDACTKSIANKKTLIPFSRAQIPSSRPSAHSHVPPIAPSVPPASHSRALNSTLGSQIPPEKNTRFWIKLHKFLRKPYDQEEYDDLWKAMNLKSPIMSHRSSRAGGSYKEGPMGKSILEKFPDVNREIEKVQPDSCKVLNLMRMLSYYLQNLARGRIPVPWKDDDTKKIMPGSRAT